jgi:WD40 repeat protein
LLISLPAFAQTNPDPGKRGLGLPVEAPKASIPYATDKSESNRPELVIQTGHSLGVTAVAFSPDNKLLASGSVDNTVKLWDVAARQELRTLTGPRTQIGAVTFSSDGQWLAGGGLGGTIHLWNVFTGQGGRSLAGHSLKVLALAFSPDNRLLASGSADNTIKIWDLETGRELHTFTGHKGWVTTVAFASDSKLLASGGKDKLVKLWTVNNSRELQTFAGHTGEITTVAFDSSGKYLVSGAMDNTLYLWDVNKHRKLQTLNGHNDRIVAVAFSSDSRSIISASSGQKTIKFWDLASGKETRSLSEPDTIEAITSAAFSPDAESLAFTTGNKNISIRKLAGAKEERPLLSRASSVYATAFSPDGKWFAAGGNDSSVSLWEVATGRELFNLPGNIGWITSVVFSPDSRLLATGGLSGNIKLWDVLAGREARILTGHTGSVNAVAFNKDSRLASASNDTTLRFWDVGTGRQLRLLEGHTSEVTSVAFSPDGLKLASGSADKTVRIWAADSGAEVRKISADVGEVNTVSFHPDGRTLAAGGRDNKAKIFEMETGKALSELSGHTGWVTAVAFAPDGVKLVTGSRDSTIKLWDLSTGKSISTLTAHADRVNSIAFSSDGRWFTSASEDGSTRLWRADTGENAATLISLVDSSDWLVVAPDGLFDGSPSAWNQILWRFGQNTYNTKPVEVFFNEYFYPGLLAEILVGKWPKAAKEITKRDRRQPQVALSVGENTAKKDGKLLARDIAVRIEVVEAPADETHTSGSGTRDLRLFRNGSLVQVWHGELPRNVNGKTVVETTIPVVAGSNQLTAYVFNQDNVKSSDAELQLIGDDTLRRKGTTYILAVGLNQYTNASFNLKYAVPDAQMFGTQLERSLSRSNSEGQTKVIILKDDEATKSNILTALSLLSGDSTDIPHEQPDSFKRLKKAQPEDNLIIFFAGHGMAYENRFYLIPFDLGYQGSRVRVTESGAQAIASHSISDREFEHSLERVDAGHIVMVLDACQSGQVLDAEEQRRGPMNSKGLAQLAYEKGLFILTASQSYQLALEAEELGHGLLTYALVWQGLEQAKADHRPKDDLVVLNEWLDYATDSVPLVHAQHLNQLMGLDRKVNLPEAEQLQRPRVFHRRELESHPWIISRLTNATKGMSIKSP